MKVFITGATGFLGRYVLLAAVAAGHKCYCIHRSFVPAELQKLDNVIWLKGGLSYDWTDILNECDAVIHLASAGVSPQQATREEYFQINVTDSLLFVESAADAGISKVIVAGSCFEYGASGERYDQIPVDAPLEPLNAYGASKAAATIAFCSLAREKGFALRILRPFHFYGEGQAIVNLWPSLKAAALAGDDFEMTAGEQVRDYMAVEDVASSFVSELEEPKNAGPKIKNIGSGSPLTLADFCSKWWKQFNAKGELLIGALQYRNGEVMRFVPKVD
ncbi:MAG: NAD-dependent epimerase/dehydratase family protein [Verrucomicrobiota bacterium]